MAEDEATQATVVACVAHMVSAWRVSLASIDERRDIRRRMSENGARHRPQLGELESGSHRGRGLLGHADDLACAAPSARLRLLLVLVP